MPSYLTKSDFIVAQSCPTKLYYRKKGYPTTLEQDQYLQLLADEAYIVEKIAKSLFPQGRAIDFSKGIQAAVAETTQALKAENAVLFEAAFLKNYQFSRADILIKKGDFLEVIEVKSKGLNGAENRARLEAGLPNCFRSRRNGQGILAPWREILEDISFTVSIVQNVFPKATVQASLMLPDKSKMAGADSIRAKFHLEHLNGELFIDYLGDISRLRQDHFLLRINVDDEVQQLTDSVKRRAKAYTASLWPAPAKIKTPLSLHCKTCQYQTNGGGKSGYQECWGNLAEVSPHLFDMYALGAIKTENDKLANQLIEQQSVSLYDIPLNKLNVSNGAAKRATRQIIQLNKTRCNEEWLSPKLPAILDSFSYPIQFIDFETTTPAVPHHPAMRPYEPVAFQWSCHTLLKPGTVPIHTEWINTQNSFPNFRFAQTLMEQLDTGGTIFIWSPHENTILRNILTQTVRRDYQNTALIDWLKLIVNAPGEDNGLLTDMHALTLQHYFHPLMKGRTSIKIVLDAIWKSNPLIRARFTEYVKEVDGQILNPYQALKSYGFSGAEFSVRNGTGAIQAYQAMLFNDYKDGSEIMERRKRLLLEYCKLDTLAMFMVWLHWRQKCAALNGMTKLAL